MGAGFDDPRSKHILSHAHALTMHSRFTLSGVTDIDRAQGEKEALRWKTEFFADASEMLEKNKPDVVIIATPSYAHAELLQKVATTNPKLIICEKPVISSAEEGVQLRKYFAKKNTQILINFPRRFDPVIQKERDLLIKGKYGRVISANAIYSNGILNNGSHIMDLARFFFGEVVSLKALDGVADHGNDDPSIAGYATFKRCPQFSLMTGDEREYSVSEFEIFAERKRLRFTDFFLTLRTQNIIADPVFKGFRGLGQQKEIKTQYSNSLMNMLDHAVSVIEGKETPRSTLEEGIRTQEACLTLLRSFRKSHE